MKPCLLAIVLGVVSLRSSIAALARLVSKRLVNMKNHKYKLGPNVHFSTEGKWGIFRASFEGVENVYAVEITK